MSNKAFLPSATIITGTNNMTGTSVITSSTFSPVGIDNIGIQMVWTGTPTGTFVVNASLDQTTWQALSLTGLTNPSGSAGNNLVNLQLFPFPYLQVVYTNASGTGSLTVKVCGRGV